MRPSHALIPLILAAALAVSAPALVAQNTFLIDFGANGSPTATGPAPDDPANSWNNVDAAVGVSDTGILFDLVTTAGTFVPGMNLEMVRRFNGANESGHTASALYPENATRDSLFGNTEPFGAGPDIFPAFKLTGLDPALVYSFTFYASRTNANDNRETEYTIAGSTTEITFLDPADNTSDTTTSVSNITPDAAGEIAISIAPGGDNNNANRFTYLGVLEIHENSADPTLTIVTEPMSQTVTEFDPATFEVVVTGAGPYDVQWFRVASPDDEPVPGATNLRYTVAETDLGMDGEMYYVVVENNTSGLTSDVATLTVNADETPPVPISADTGNGSVIIVEFSEPLDPATASNPASYTVTSASGNPAVTEAVLSADRISVTLTLASPVTGTFTVSAGGVTDRAGNAAVATVEGEAVAAAAAVYLFDFGGTDTFNGPPPGDPLNFWNNVPNFIGQTDDQILGGVVTIAGAPSPVTLEMIRRFNNTNTNGTTMSSRFPASASGDSLYGNTETWQDLLPTSSRASSSPASSPTSPTRWNSMPPASASETTARRNTPSPEQPARPSRCSTPPTTSRRPSRWRASPRPQPARSLSPSPRRPTTTTATTSPT
ncbi:hypothetical protein BH23VER1_BH23VER1_18300 [soil metagenome]